MNNSFPASNRPGLVRAASQAVRPHVRVAGVVLKGSEADQQDHEGNDHRPDPISRDHGTRPRFIEKAATSQYSQNAAHTTAKTTSTALIAPQTATVPG
jgi:hypothetical protein